MKVAKIETEKMLISMVETELTKRKTAGLYSGNFKGQSHFFGYGFESTLILHTACINVLGFNCAYIRCRRNAWGFFGPGCDYLKSLFGDYMQVNARLDETFSYPVI